MKRILSFISAIAISSSLAHAGAGLMEKPQDYVNIPELKTYLADIDVAAESFKLHRLDTKHSDIYALDGKTMIVAYVVQKSKAPENEKMGERFAYWNLYKDTPKRLEFSCPATGEFLYVVLYRGLIPDFEKSCILKLVK